jgi:hypothetical protein
LTGGRIADRSATAGSARTRIAASIEQHAALFARFGASVVDGAATVRVWIAELVGLARSAAQDTAASIVDRTAARAAPQTSFRHTRRIAAARASAAISGSAARACRAVTGCAATAASMIIRRGVAIARTGIDVVLASATRACRAVTSSFVRLRRARDQCEGDRTDPSPPEFLDDCHCAPLTPLNLQPAHSSERRNLL